MMAWSLKLTKGVPHLREEEKFYFVALLESN
jgi:hypothetical protein